MSILAATSFSPKAVLPSEKKIDLAIFQFDEPDKVYEAAFRFAEQLRRAIEEGYEFRRCFIILDLTIKEIFDEAIRETFPDLGSEVNYTSLVDLALRVAALFKSPCTYTIISPIENACTDQIKAHLAKENFCGILHLPLENEEEISKIDQEMENILQELIKNQGI